MLRPVAEVGALAIGLLMGHELTYALVSADAHEAARLWASTGHAAVSPGRLVLAVTFALVVQALWRTCAFAAERTSVTGHVLPQITAFVCLEQVERAAVGTTVWERPWLLLLGVAVQVVVAAGIVALRNGLECLRSIGRRASPTWSTAGLPPSRPYGPVVLSSWWLVDTRPTRGPPAL